VKHWAYSLLRRTLGLFALSSQNDCKNRQDFFFMAYRIWSAVDRSGVLGTTHGGVRHSFVIQQYPESSPLELTSHSFFVQRPLLLLLLESWGQRPPQKVPTYLSFTVSDTSPVSTLLAVPPYDVATLCGVL
jgi:hypothetical protein